MDLMSKQLEPRALATRARVLLVALSVLALATPSSCGSDSSKLPDGAAPRDGSIDSGGAAGHGGAGVDGGAHDAAGGASAGGMTGTNDWGSPMREAIPAPAAPSWTAPST